MLSRLRQPRYARLIAGPALAALMTLAACTHIEPQRVHGKDALIGDKMWNYVHPWYHVEWKWWAKAIYWIGPGH